MTNVYPLTNERRAEIVQDTRRYIETSGAEGHAVDGVPHLVLTTTGRRSGAERSTMLIYARDGDRYLIVASLGGYDKPPHWYLNLLSNPEVAVQVADERFPAIARTASAQERPRLWEIVCEGFPRYLEYQTRTEREIPVVILERLAPGAAAAGES